MINHNKAEHAACKSMGWTIQLCKFHLSKAWCQALQQATHKCTLFDLVISSIFNSKQQRLIERGEAHTDQGFSASQAATALARLKVIQHALNEEEW